LVRTVTTYERGFAGWKKTDSASTRAVIRCDGTGRVFGDLNGQISLQGSTLFLGATPFTLK
jgi:hypothetical protein